MGISWGYHGYKKDLVANEWRFVEIDGDVWGFTGDLIGISLMVI
jgi:hypothetical protein